jgi:hypothetical protein
MIVSLLIAAEATSFCLNTKRSKKIKTEKSFPTRAFTLGPLFCQAPARLILPKAISLSAQKPNLKSAFCYF